MSQLPSARDRLRAHRAHRALMAARPARPPFPISTVTSARSRSPAIASPRSAATRWSCCAHRARCWAASITSTRPSPEVARKHRANADEVLRSRRIPDDDLEQRAPTIRSTTKAHVRRCTTARRVADPPAMEEGWRCCWRRTTPARRERSPDLDWRRRRPLHAGHRRRRARAAAARARVGPRHLPTVGARGCAGGADMAALAGDHLLRSSDGGTSWSLLAVLAARPRADRDSADGRDVFVLDDDGVAIVAHRQRTPILDGRAYHLVRCGPDLLILGADGVNAWRSDRGLEPLSPRIPARRLACAHSAPEARPRPRLRSEQSFDGGRTWRARDDLPRRRSSASQSLPTDSGSGRRVASSSCRWSQHRRRRRLPDHS